MAAVQFSDETAVLIAVSPGGGDTTVAAVRRRRLRRVRLAYELSARESGRASPYVAEAEDHWDDGARAQLGMVGVTYRAY